MADPRSTTPAAARQWWEERFDLGPLRVGYPNAASGHECYLRPVWYRNMRESTSVNRLRQEVMKPLLGTPRLCALRYIDKDVVGFSPQPQKTKIGDRQSICEYLDLTWQ